MNQERTRIMAVDFGDARTGVAFSDLSATIIGETFTIKEYQQDRLLLQLVSLIGERNVGTVVFGLPKNMDGSEGSRAELCRAFAARLKDESGVPVILWDERRTTIEAHNILHANGKREKKHRKTVDAVAASLILEGYLSSQR